MFLKICIYSFFYSRFRCIRDELYRSNLEGLSSQDTNRKIWDALFCKRIPVIT